MRGRRAEIDGSVGGGGTSVDRVEKAVDEVGGGGGSVDCVDGAKRLSLLDTCSKRA